MTASATMEDLKPRKPKLAAAALDLAEIDNAEAAEPESQTSALFPGPQSWMVLVLIVGIVGSSLLVSRYLTRPEFVASPASPRTEVATHEPTFAQELAPSLPPIQIRKPAQKPKATPVEPNVPEDEQRFLQRLIMNKVTLIEEEVDPPTVDHLHGVAVGASRMIVHEAHKELVGPHFQVRAVGDQRAVELRLRRLLRADRPTKHTDEFVQSADTQEPRESKTGPLERALRTVERGVTQ